MDDWIRFDERVPAEGQYIAAITQADQDLPVEAWEQDLEKNAVGVWVDGVVWVGNTPQGNFTHWLPLPERPCPLTLPGQREFWFKAPDGSLQPERRRAPRP